MSAELWLLAASLVLALAQIGLASLSAKKQTGIEWSVGPRDEARPVSGVPARLERAQRNLMETLPIFAGAVLLVEVAQRTGWASELGAYMFFWGRLAYVPAYSAGIPWVRSILWNVATAGIVLVLLSLVL
ncbi:MAG: MAPEG family protein [Reyranellaceae bacterium]